MRRYLVLPVLRGRSASCADNPPDEDPTQMKLKELDSGASSASPRASAQLAQRMDECRQTCASSAAGSMSSSTTNEA